MPQHGTPPGEHSPALQPHGAGPQTETPQAQANSATHVSPGKRDPEARRLAIIAAAAELILEGGLPALTHRAAATRAGVSLGSTTQYFTSLDELRDLAYRRLADEIDAELAEMAKLLPNLIDHPEAVADLVLDFLLDDRQVRADIALLHAATTDSTRRSLALRWFDRLVDLITEHFDRETALAVAVYLDGATVHAGLHDAPLDRAHLSRVLRALTGMSGRARSGAIPTDHTSTALTADHTPMKVDRT